MKKFIPLFGLLLLAGCDSGDPTLIKTELKVAVPDNSMYICPIENKFPNPATLTDVQTAKMLLRLYQNNKICKNSLDSIKAFIDNAQKTIERK